MALSLPPPPSDSRPSLTSPRRAKKHKYPYGYPGDAVSESNRYFACHLCAKVFPAVGDDANVQMPECKRCQHVRCPACAPATPRRVEPESDPEELKKLEERIKDMNLGQGAAAA